MLAAWVAADTEPRRRRWAARYGAAPRRYADVVRGRRWLERGVLPREGGWLRQNPYWLAAMEAVEDAEAAVREKREEAMERAREREGGGSADLGGRGAGASARPTGRTRADLERRGVV